MRKILIICFAMLALATCICAEAHTVRGTVRTEDNEPLPGATVIVGTTQRGTTTDIEGQYEIEATEGDTLRFAFIGYGQQLEPVGNRTLIDVTLMSDNRDLSEVIVIAYGTTRRASFTGSQALVGANDISMRPTTNAVQALAGKVAGVQISSASGQPGAEATLRVRGFGSLSASNDPLIVVDGAPYEGTLSQLNTQDIESLTVLKDASASAIYGARGGNGVVMITTKRGRTEEAEVNLEAQWGVNSNGLKAYKVMTDPAMYLETHYRALYNSRVYGGATTAEAHQYANSNLSKSLGTNIYTIGDDQRLVGTNFRLNPSATLGYSDGTHYYTPDDWKKETLLSHSSRQMYNASVSAQTDRLGYYLSVGRLDDKGIVKNTGFERTSARLRADYEVREWLKVGANIGYSKSQMQADDDNDIAQSGQNAFVAAYSMAPIYPMYVRNADKEIARDDMGRPLFDYGQERNYLNGSNPAGDAELNDNNAMLDDFESVWTASLSPIEGLTLTANISYNVTNNRSTALENPTYGPAAPTNGKVMVGHNREESQNQQYLINYKRYSPQGLGLDILLGYENYENTKHDFAAQNTTIFSPSIPELGNAVGTSPTAHSQMYAYATEGFFGRVQADLLGRYFVSGSMRRDASSCFDPDSRWGTFGSIGAAWLMSEEAWARNITRLSLLKIKASVGVQGNDDLGRNYSAWAYKPYQDSYLISYSGNPEQPFAVTFSNKGNRDITWETSTQWNVGIDFGLMGGRIGGQVDIFGRTTTDLLYQQPVSNTLGYASMPANVGDMTNKGIEIDLHATVLKLKDAEWSIYANLTHLSNEVTDLAPEAKANGGIKDDCTIIRVGGSIYNSYLPRYAGVDRNTGEALYYKDPDAGDYTTTAVYADAMRSDLGTTLPTVYGGLGTQVNALGFDLSAMFSYQLGGKIYDAAYQTYMHSGHVSTAGCNWHADILRSWTPEQPDTDVPRLSAADATQTHVSDRFLTSSDYLSIDGVTLGYSMHESLTERIGIKRMRVYAQCNNVALWSKRQGLDPRSAFGAQSTTESTTFGYSPMRTIVGGIQLTF